MGWFNNTLESFETLVGTAASVVTHVSDNRTDRKIARQEEKSDRSGYRQSRKAMSHTAAYNAGIDPNAAAWGSMGSMVSSVAPLVAGAMTGGASMGASSFGSFFSGGGSTGGGYSSSGDTGVGGGFMGMTSGTILIIAAVFAAFIAIVAMPFRKRRK